MHNVHVVTKNVFLSALVALVVMAGVLLILAPPASAAREECAAARVCLWSGRNYDGTKKSFNGEDHGWHTLAGINPQTAWNHTGNHPVYFQEIIWIYPGETIGIWGGFTGQIFIE